METILAKEFLTKTFTIDWMTSEEIDTIATAMELYAKGKCREQRELCCFHARPILTNEMPWDQIRIDENSILNAPEPKFDLPEIKTS